MCNEFSQIFQLCQFVMVSHISFMIIFKIPPFVPNSVINSKWSFTGKLPKRSLSPCNFGNFATIPELDSSGIYI